MIYVEGIKCIDYDDVIQDTTSYNWKDKYGNSFKFNSYEEEIEHAKKIDWEKALKNSLYIADSIYILKQLDPKKHFILTKCHGELEGYHKTINMRKQGVKIPVVPVHYLLKKCQVISASGNLLVDDSIKNLIEWNEENGESLYFSKDGTDVDNWGISNNSFPKVKSLEFLLK